MNDVYFWKWGMRINNGRYSLVGKGPQMLMWMVCHGVGGNRDICSGSVWCSDHFIDRLGSCLADSQLPGRSWGTRSFLAVVALFSQFLGDLHALRLVLVDAIC